MYVVVHRFASLISEGGSHLLLALQPVAYTNSIAVTIYFLFPLQVLFPWWGGLAWLVIDLVSSRSCWVVYSLQVAAELEVGYYYFILLLLGIEETNGEPTVHQKWWDFQQQLLFAENCSHIMLKERVNLPILHSHELLYDEQGKRC